MTARTASALALALGLLGAARAQDPAQLKPLLEEKARSIAVVKLVLKVEIQVMGQTQDQEQRTTIPGVLVNDTGLVMITNSAVSAARMKEMFGGMDEGEERFEVTMTPLSIKVILEGEEKEHDAFLAASDARLDLAFLQIEELGERKVAPVQFPEDAALEVGQRVVGVSRLSEGFDYAPRLELGHVVGRIKKPRPAWLVSGAGEGVGLPVFDLSGKALGAFSLISSGVRDEDEGGMFGMGGGGMGGRFQVVLIPAGVVKGVIDQATTRAAEVAAERKKSGVKGPGELPGGEQAPSGGEKKTE